MQGIMAFVWQEKTRDVNDEEAFVDAGAKMLYMHAGC